MNLKYTKESRSQKSIKVHDLRVSQAASDMGKSERVKSELARSDLTKSLQTFKTNTSPKTQPLSSSTIQYGGRMSPKRNSAIVNKSQLKGMHEKTVIKLLGLNMEAVCPKDGHASNKIQFICAKPDCESERLGCAYCQLREHGDHPTYNLEIQSFFRTFDEQNREINQLLKSQVPVTDYQDIIIQEFQKIRNTVNERLNQLQLQVSSEINAFNKFQLKHLEIESIVNSLQKKTVFEMSHQDLEHALELVQGTYVAQLQQILSSQDQQIATRTHQIDEAVQLYFKQLNTDLIASIDDNVGIFLEDPKSKDYAQLKIKHYQKKSMKLSQEVQPFELLIQEHERIEEIQRQQFLEEQQQKQIQEQQLQQEIILEQEQQQIQQYQEQIKRTFPYTIYHANCNHRLPCNTIPIYSCCNRAYPCIQCHGFALHPPILSIPNKRYCMNCLDIYQVATSQPVNCLKCL